ncbi:ATP-binding protein [Actinomycetospora sp. C-140]
MGAAGLWERQAELDVLTAALDAAVAGAGEAVLLAGPAGIGKTTVVREFLRTASTRARVLLGACEDLVAPRTLGPLRDAVAGRDGPLAAALRPDAAEDVLTAALTELAARPTVLVVEDLHWADDATLDVVRYVGRRIADVPAVLVVTYRDDEIDGEDRLRRALGALTTAPTHRLALRPLSRTAVAQWAGGTNVTTAPLYTLTGGNPFFLSEVLAAPDAAVPATVVDAVLARARGLDPGVRRALDQLAVVPARVEMPLVRAVIGDRSVLDDAERAGLLEVTPQAVAFRHELARRALEGAIPTSTRLDLHARVLAALHHDDAPDPDRLVHHAVGAGDDAAVVAHAPEAARRAVRAGAQSQAVQLFAEVVRRREVLTPEEDAQIHEEYGWALFHAGRYAEAAAASAEAVRGREDRGDAAALARALASAATHQWSDLRPDDALASARRAVTLLDGAGAAGEYAAAYSYLGAFFTTVGREDEAVPVLDAALAASERLGDSRVRTTVLVFRGQSRFQRGDTDGLDDVREGLRRARAGGDHEPAMLAYLNLVLSLWQTSDLEEMDDVLADAARYGADRDFASYERIRETYRLRRLALRGEWDAAETGLRGLVDDRPDGGVLDRFALPYLAGLAVRRGAGDAATLVDRARELAVRNPSVVLSAAVLTARLEQAWLTGGSGPVDEAAALLREGPTTGRWRDLAELARWLRRVGGPVVPVAGAPEELAAGLDGDTSTAAAAWERVGAPYERALELAESGEAEPLLRALDVLHDLGATPAAALVRRRLAERGVRPPRGPQEATRTNPAGLTNRQLDILRLLAGGRTNTEIAEELVLSVRTVDHHVSAVLAKLGVGSRRDAAAAAGRLGLA